jgi:hypothetical protein
LLKYSIKFFDMFKYHFRVMSCLSFPPTERVDKTKKVNDVLDLNAIRSKATITEFKYQ